MLVNVEMVSFPEELLAICYAFLSKVPFVGLNIITRTTQIITGALWSLKKF